jgi:methyl-accepting chemotaxis protein
MKLKIGGKIVLSYTVVLLVMAAISILGIQADRKITNEYMNLIERSLPGETIIYRLRSELLEKGLALRGYILSGNPAEIERFHLLDENVEQSMDKARMLSQAGKSLQSLELLAEINDRYDLLAEDISHLVQLGMTEEATALMADEGALILGQVDDVIAE